MCGVTLVRSYQFRNTCCGSRKSDFFADGFAIVELSFLISNSGFIKHHHAWNEEKVCKFIEPDCCIFS